MSRSSGGFVVGVVDAAGGCIVMVNVKVGNSGVNVGAELGVSLTGTVDDGNTVVGVGTMIAVGVSAGGLVAVGNSGVIVMDGACVAVGGGIGVGVGAGGGMQNAKSAKITSPSKNAYNVLFIYFLLINSTSIITDAATRIAHSTSATTGDPPSSYLFCKSIPEIITHSINRVASVYIIIAFI